MYRQSWTLKKVIYYISYRILFKHLPGDLPVFGILFQFFRRIICRPLFKEAAQIISIGQGVDFDNGCNVVLKEYANIGSYCSLGGNHGMITIGKHVMMGAHCTIISQNHKYIEPEGYRGFDGKDIVIREYAWIGDKVIILPGVTIGKHAIIGAGTVVPKDIPDYAIAVGNPAVVKKFRNEKVVKEDLCQKQKS